MKRKRDVLIGATLLALIVALGIGQAVIDKTAVAQGTQAPMFEVDPFWPQPLPNQLLLGNAIGVWVDDQDHIWIVHRTDALTGGERGATMDPPTGECCSPAPPVLEFDRAGKLLRHWVDRDQATSGRTRIMDCSSTTWATCGSAATAVRTHTS